MNIHSIETFGTHEGPGIRLVIFLQGCNYRCLYCHNPDTQSLKQKLNNKPPLNLPLSKGEQVGVQELVDLAKKNQPYFGAKGGVTVSGGEPLLQAKELIQYFKKLKNIKIHTALDTNGSLLTPAVKELLKYTDLVLLDIKQIDPRKHQLITGCSISNDQLPTRLPDGQVTNQTQNNNSTIEQLNNHSVPSITFAKYLQSISKPFWVRYVLVPGFTDDEADLIKLGETLKDFDNLERIEILPYHTLGVHKHKELGLPYKLEGVKPPNKEEIEKAKNIIEKYSHKPVFIR